MDLIGSLASQLGVDGNVAEALAGQVLGMTRDQVGDAETAKLDEAVPEISSWQETAKAMLEGESAGGGGMLGSLVEMAGSGLGKEVVGAVLGEDAENTATLAALISKLGLKSEHATMAAPVVIEFLEERVGKEWVGRIMDAAPMLSGFLGKK